MQLFLKLLSGMANSVDLDQMPHSVVRMKRFIEILLYHILILFLMIRISNREASIMIPDDTPKSTISKENDSFNIYQDHFCNKLQRSKMLLKYTDHLYDKQEPLTRAF